MLVFGAGGGGQEKSSGGESRNIVWKDILI